MLMLLIDAGVLMVLLKTINDDDVGFGSALLLALVTSVGTLLLALGLVEVMGTAGVFVAAILAAVLLGIAVSALFGVEIKRSMLIGVIFIVVHVAASFGITAMFQPLQQAMHSTLSSPDTGRLTFLRDNAALKI
jgi:hypothetical protein